MAFHSKTGGSATDRFLNCVGSVSLIKGAGLTEREHEEPDYRADGTIAHEVASECLRRNLDAWEFMIPELHRFKKEHAAAVQQYIDFVWNRKHDLLARFGTVEMRVETHVTHPDEPDFFGTIDTALICPDYAEVIDYKHGVHYAVEVIRNGQLMYYAHGLQMLYPDIGEFNLVIVQPRGFHRDGPVREWAISGQELREWGETVLIPGIRAAQEGAGPIIPGNWCAFCPVKLACPVLAGMAKAAAIADTTAVASMSNAALGREFELSGAAERYFKAVYTEVSRRAMSGEEGPWKVVKKKATRQWVPGYQAPRMSVEMSPAQAELRMANGKELTAEFATVPPEAGMTVVGLSDPRPAVTRTAIDFEGLEDDT